MRKIQRKCKNLKCYLNKFYELINKLEKFESIDEFLKSEQKYSKGIYKEKDICYQFGKISTLRLENTVFFIRMIFFSIKSTCHKKY